MVPPAAGSVKVDRKFTESVLMRKSPDTAMVMGAVRLWVRMSMLWIPLNVPTSVKNVQDGLSGWMMAPAAEMLLIIL